jgi:hypothetical protein
VRAAKLSAVLAVLAALAAAAPAQGAVTLGATEADFGANFGAGDNVGCTIDPCAIWQDGHPLGRISVTPFDGVLVRWRVRIHSLFGATDARMSLRLVGPATGPLLWGLQGPLIEVPDSPELPKTVFQDLRIPISRGQGIASQFENLGGGYVLIATRSIVGGTLRSIASPPPPGATGDGTPGSPDTLLAVAADVETDADRDGFGDESQDACPTDATTQGACPPGSPGPPGDPGDISPPGLSWCGKRKQDLLDSGAVTACVRTNELAAIGAAGRLTIRSGDQGTGSVSVVLRSAKGAVAPGAKALLQLKLGRRARARVAAALRRGRRVSARITVTGTDAAGNNATVGGTVTAR